MSAPPLSKVMSWMRFFGWTGDGGPGSVKHNADDHTIARHGDATWVKDVEDACTRADREVIIEELERRDRERRVAR